MNRRNFLMMIGVGAASTSATSAAVANDTTLYSFDLDAPYWPLLFGRNDGSPKELTKGLFVGKQAALDALEQFKSTLPSRRAHAGTHHTKDHNYGNYKFALDWNGERGTIHIISTMNDEVDYSIPIKLVEVNTR